jgi:hypothetical protein
MAQVVRHFVFKHPLFKKEKTAFGVRWQDSVYYLWWEFLRRHEGYRKTCEVGGKGQFAGLYKDFGNVFAGDFKTWWSTGDRGAGLFAEPAIPMTVTALTVEEAAALPSDASEAGLLLIAVPLRLSKSEIKKKINSLLMKKHDRKRGERLFEDSRALYPVASSVNIHATKLILATYDMRMNNPSMPLWRIGHELKLGTTLTAQELASDGRKQNIDKKNRLAAAASRKLKQAKLVIEGVGKGQFPVLN